MPWVQCVTTTSIIILYWNFDQRYPNSTNWFLDHLQKYTSHCLNWPRWNWYGTHALWTWSKQSTVITPLLCHPFTVCVDTSRDSSHNRILIAHLWQAQCGCAVGDHGGLADDFQTSFIHFPKLDCFIYSDHQYDLIPSSSVRYRS